MGVRPDRQKSDQCGSADLVRNKFFRRRKATAQDIRGSTSGDLVNMVAGQEMAGLAQSLESDPQVDTLLRGRSRELGLGRGNKPSRGSEARRVGTGWIIKCGSRG